MFVLLVNNDIFSVNAKALSFLTCWNRIDVDRPWWTYQEAKDLTKNDKDLALKIEKKQAGSLREMTYEELVETNPFSPIDELTNDEAASSNFNEYIFLDILKKCDQVLTDGAENEFKNTDFFENDDKISSILLKMKEAKIANEKEEKDSSIKELELTPPTPANVTLTLTSSSLSTKSKKMNFDSGLKKIYNTQKKGNKPQIQQDDITSLSSKQATVVQRNMPSVGGKSPLLGKAITFEEKNSPDMCSQNNSNKTQIHNNKGITLSPGHHKNTSLPSDALKDEQMIEYKAWLETLSPDGSPVFNKWGVCELFTTYFDKLEKKKNLSTENDEGSNKTSFHIWLKAIIEETKNIFNYCFKRNGQPNEFCKFQEIKNIHVAFLYDFLVGI